MTLIVRYRLKQMDAEGQLRIFYLFFYHKEHKCIQTSASIIDQKVFLQKYNIFFVKQINFLIFAKKSAY